MTKADRFRHNVESMFYVLGAFMFVAGCIVIVGYIGRGPREDDAAGREKRP